MWFSEHFFAPKLAGLIVTPIVSATVEQKWREKCLKNHIPVDFWDDSTLANKEAGKAIEKPLKELPWNQQIGTFESQEKRVEKLFWECIFALLNLKKKINLILKDSTFIASPKLEILDVILFEGN